MKITSLTTPFRHNGFLRFFWCLCFAFILILSGCGYQRATKFPSVIGDGTKTVRIKSVDNPTMNTTIGYLLRSQLREEISARHMAKWVDSGVSDYTLELKIKQFTDRGETFDDTFNTQLYNINLTLNLIVYDGVSNKKVWESGYISETDFSERLIDRDNSEELATLLMRRIVDQMKNNF
ncbi:LPS assembly lipoprotein LptE [Desulfovibrio litoralis]|uniref:Lipopolysaccharide-assembly n=1 Tax=Desulfovibrio litoralis DSM 11393 TaxID=1121455 RepID=A0A1M7TAU5_9BACT|nr:LPS assembly lipoprotein LptE [Desulfovibrio litoralis]SHN67849.1 Lipopolysaccharide-assembly [Desulfovibrio litoralis DSM 11393]